MEHGHQPPKKDDDNRSSRNQSFFTWLHSQYALLGSQIFGILSSLYIITSLYYYITKGEYFKNADLTDIQQIIYWCHIPILLVFIFWLVHIRNKNSNEEERVPEVYERVFKRTLSNLQLIRCKIQLRRFKTYFLFFWLGMLMLYGAFLFKLNWQEMKEVPNKSEIFIKVQEALKSKENAELKYRVDEINTLVKESKIEEGNTDEKIIINRVKEIYPLKEDEKAVRAKINETYNLIKESKKIKMDSKTQLKIVFVFFTFALNNLGSLLIFCCFTILYLPVYNHEPVIKQKQILIYSATIVTLFTLSFPLFVLIEFEKGLSSTDLSGIIIGYEALSGVINAVTLALLIGRLDSKFIGLPSVLISILYGYSAVQPLFVAFEQEGEVFQIIKTFVLITVFIFKIYFFFIITYALQTGRMLNYLACFPMLDTRVDSIFANNFSIETVHDEKGYSFKVKRKNRVVFTGSEHFESEEEFLNEIQKLREAAKNKSSYDYKKKDEISKKDKIRTLKIVDSHNHVICYNDKLKTITQIEQLREESIKMIPYCERIP